ncbi:MAG: hypothetical protein ACYYKD_05050 [Rhodospirillales bacterium]
MAAKPKNQESEMPMKHIKSKAMKIKDTGHDEKWLQNYIADNPSVLGLGDLSFVEKERRQPDASRLDLLFQDEPKANRYAVEVQLNSPDPDHIIRAIGYWDSERRRFPEYNYCAVLVAENVLGGRYSNVVSLLSEKFPLIVIQVTASQLESKGEFALVFTTVLEDPNGEFKDKNSTPADRSYWAQGSTAETIKWVDELFGIVKDVCAAEEGSPKVELNFLKGYIGLRLNGVSRNFVTFNPTRNGVTVSVKIPKGGKVQDWDKEIAAAGIETKEYEERYNNYRLVLENRKDISNNKDFLREIMKYAYDYRMGTL